MNVILRVSKRRAGYAFVNRYKFLLYLCGLVVFLAQGQGAQGQELNDCEIIDVQTESGCSQGGTQEDWACLEDELKSCKKSNVQLINSREDAYKQYQILDTEKTSGIWCGLLVAA